MTARSRRRRLLQAAHRRGPHQRIGIVETGLQQVTAIDLATGDTSPVIVGLDYSDRIPEGFFPFGMISGIAVGERSIYVSDDGVNQVYEFRRHP